DQVLTGPTTRDEGPLPGPLPARSAARCSADRRPGRRCRRRADPRGRRRSGRRPAARRTAAAVRRGTQVAEVEESEVDRLLQLVGPVAEQEHDADMGLAHRYAAIAHAVSPLWFIGHSATPVPPARCPGGAD